MIPTRSYALHPLAWLTAALPLVAIHLSYVLSAHHGHVEWCVPYVHSCTSISATGREPPAYFVFKGLMIPAAVLMAAYWVISAAWLRQMGCERHVWQRVLVTLGVLASVGLVVYALVLGWIGDAYRLQRHTGVLIFFSFTFLAQLLLTWLLEQRPAIARGQTRLMHILQGGVLLTLALGLGSVAVAYLAPDLYKRSDDAMAWNFTVLLCLHVMLCAVLWQRTGLRASFATTPFRSSFVDG